MDPTRRTTDGVTPADGPPAPADDFTRTRPATPMSTAVKAELAPVALVAIVLAAIRGLVQDSQVIPHALTWYLGSAPAWYIRRQNRRHLRQQMLDAPAG